MPRKKQTPEKLVHNGTLRVRGPDQWGKLPPACGAVPCSHPEARRPRRHGYSRLTQGRGRQAGNQGCWHKARLPAYSPDVNPIEQVFAKLKNFLRRPK